MASIFDLFSGNATPEQNAGLLGFATQMLNASNGRQPVNFGQALAAGANGFQQGRDMYADNERQKRMLDLQAQLMGYKVKDAESDLANQQLMRDRAARISARLAPQSLPQMGSDQGAPQQPLAGGAPALPPTSTPAAAAPSNRTEDYIQRMIQVAQAHAEEGDVDGANKIYEQIVKLRPKFDSGITWVNGPDGKPVAVRTADDGSLKQLDGLAPRDKLELANLGGKDMAYNPYALQPGQTFERTMTPGEVATNRLGWANNAATLRGQNMTDARARDALAAQAAKDKAPTEFQGKSATFGARAEEANRILDSLAGKYSPAAINSKLSVQEWPLVGGALGAATNKFALSPETQQAEQAQRDFVNAILRQESGAAIGAGEFDNARKQYFPQPGDSAAVIQQKARNRAAAVQGLKVNAGKAAFSVAPPAKASGGWSITKVGN